MKKYVRQDHLRDATITEWSNIGSKRPVWYTLHQLRGNNDRRVFRRTFTIQWRGVYIIGFILPLIAFAKRLNGNYITTPGDFR